MNRILIISVSVFFIMSCSSRIPHWEVVKGESNAWDFKIEELKCTVTSAGPHWVLSEESIAGHWVLEAEVLSTASDASQGILFAVGADLSHGFLLTLQGTALNLSRISQGETISVQTWQTEGETQASKRELKIAKRGATYTFSIDGKIVNTLTLTRLPDKGRYGFAFQDEGTYTVSDLQLHFIQLSEKYAGNPVLPSKGPKGAWDENQAFTATIRKFGDTYYLYYTGVDAADPRLEGGGIGRIGVATSKDGYHFEKYADNPVFDRIDPETGKSLKLQGMSVVQLPDERYALSYTVWDGQRWHALEYAVASSPLGPFELGPHNPIITTGHENEFDGIHVHLHNIIRLDDGNYVLLYTGFNPKYHADRLTGENALPSPDVGDMDFEGGDPEWINVGDQGGLATSEDYTKWEKYPGNPVFRLGERGAWDDQHVRPKGFIKYGEYYYMFYEGAHYNQTEQRDFWFDQDGMARSRDLINWERFPHNPIIPGGGRDSIVTEWPIPIETEDGLAVFYWGGGPGDVAISRAEIPRELLERWGAYEK